MKKTLLTSMLAAAALLTLGSEARAQANLHNGDDLRPGDNLVYGEVGWPDLTVGWQHGISSIFDIGVKASLPYGFEYRTYSYTTVGLGVRVPLRITPVRTNLISFQIRFEPGLKFDAFGSTCNSVGPGGVVAVCNGP